MASEVRTSLAPLCKAFEVAGSIRRQKMDMIKDCEFVIIPDNAKLFELASIINSKWGEPQIGKFPSKYVRIRGRFNLDIFVNTRETFGLNYFIRTGPDSFCRRALAAWKIKTSGGYSEDCQLHTADGKIVPTPTEASVFAALGWNFVKPENRT
jgi:DNA polymerase/3'-5' exonuclease PolX